MTVGWLVKNEATPAESSRIHSQQPMTSPAISVVARTLPSDMAVASVHIKSGPGLAISATQPIM